MGGPTCKTYRERPCTYATGTRDRGYLRRCVDGENDGNSGRLVVHSLLRRCSGILRMAVRVSGGGVEAVGMGRRSEEEGGSLARLSPLHVPRTTPMVSLFLLLIFLFRLAARDRRQAGH